MVNSSIQSLQVDTYTRHILEALAPVPEVMEVEVSPEGRWRPSGSAGAFMDVGHPFDPKQHSTKAPAGAAGPAAAAGGGVKIKPEPGM